MRKYELCETFKSLNAQRKTYVSRSHEDDDETCSQVTSFIAKDSADSRLAIIKIAQELHKNIELNN